jgi:hypothetical protein
MKSLNPSPSPFAQFSQWFNDACASPDPHLRTRSELRRNIRRGLILLGFKSGPDVISRFFAMLQENEQIEPAGLRQFMVHRLQCTRCGTPTACPAAPDPYLLNVHDRTEMVRLCPACRHDWPVQGDLNV